MMLSLITSNFVRYLALACALIFHSLCVNAEEQNPFVFEIATEPKRVGDIKPAYIVYKDRKLPSNIKIEQVLKRYVKLFEETTSPDVKVDALNRINNLSAKYGLSSKKLAIDAVKQSEAVLESYDRIVDSGVFYQRMDELLYQTAKAMSFIGNPEESVKRLKLLVGLYPQSKLVDESQFRIAEAYFSTGKFAKAEAEYKKILSFSKTDTFHQRAKFKLGWSLFRLNKYLESGKMALKSLDYYPGLKAQVDLDSTPEIYHEIIEDTLRLLAIVFSKQDDANSIEALQAETNNTDYAFLMYDALFRFYLAQERYEEAASATYAYTRAYPNDFYAYRMGINTIRSYKTGAFDIKEWDAKEDLVKQFGIKSPYWPNLSDKQKKELKPHLIAYLGELAHLYYIRMQKTKTEETKTAHALQASDYYLELAATEPNLESNGEHVYLAAEANTVAKKYQEAIKLYERSAYTEASHKNAPEAGYAVILTYDSLKDQNKVLSDELKLNRRGHIEKFASAFNNDKRTPALLNDLANELLQEQDYVYAVSTSDRVIAHEKANAKQRYSSWLVNARGHFELANYNKAENAFSAALSFNKKADRLSLRENLAASIYKQAELEADPTKAAALFLKVADAVPDASIVSNALYDASVKQLEAQDWVGAISSLNAFQASFSESELYEDATEKLIFAYTNNDELLSAAEKLVDLSSTTENKERSESALYQAAEYYGDSGFAYEANQLYERFVSQFPGSFDLNIEAYDRVVSFYHAESLQKAAKDWQRKFVSYERTNKKKRTDRSAYLAANAVFDLTQDEYDAFVEAKLTLPLKQSLKNKRALMDSAVKQYESVAEYEIGSLTSAATYQIASIYQQLAKDLMSSQRPNSLDELQLEQYDILLEEQAYPFEEQAIEIFNINTLKVKDGYYDEWIAKTFERLASINPTEYAREFKGISNAPSIF